MSKLGKNRNEKTCNRSTKNKNSKKKKKSIMILEISLGAKMMLDAFKRLEKKFEVMQKERKSDKAVIHKLLRDIKTLKKIRT